MCAITLKSCGGSICLSTSACKNHMYELSNRKTLLKQQDVLISLKGWWIHKWRDITDGAGGLLCPNVAVICLSKFQSHYLHCHFLFISLSLSLSIYLSICLSYKICVCHCTLWFNSIFVVYIHFILYVFPLTLLSVNLSRIIWVDGLETKHEPDFAFSLSHLFII